MIPYAGRHYEAEHRLERRIGAVQARQQAQEAAVHSRIRDWNQKRRELEAAREEGTINMMELMHISAVGTKAMIASGVERPQPTRHVYDRYDPHFQVPDSH